MSGSPDNVGHGATVAMDIPGGASGKAGLDQRAASIAGWQTARI